MSLHLHMIYGPTTTGKTARAVALAQRTGAPVIALDRIQCHFELAVGSGRPSPAELEETRRVYLCERPVAVGQLPADEANRLLHESVERFGEREPLLIVEGGSISLLQAIAADSRWTSYRWSFERLPLPPREVYLDRAERRVREMFSSASGRSILDELLVLWPDPRSRPVLADVDGYRAIIAYARRRELPIIDLARLLTVTDYENLVQDIALEYLGHAEDQERGFPRFA